VRGYTANVAVTCEEGLNPILYMQVATTTLHGKIPAARLGTLVFRSTAPLSGSSAGRGFSQRHQFYFSKLYAEKTSALHHFFHQNAKPDFKPVQP
jgi:hypothetical protein